MRVTYNFNSQFCKNFRVGERCCEFECLDPPGEDNKYQVIFYELILSIIIYIYIIASLI